ncbi:MAG: glutamyl-tRNA(Gln) amidotransferase subunit E [Candidatus Altiarchaeales archaeon WOR_SM1_86-2]|nr:MAG: glutamyl-tRNA(Gln) amidotransferase subunit E [Candidatus Altiarchaeales archaeon WOR_SM1_86-2]
MTLNYQKLGFKAGIEIHQQLDTHKLFCGCPSELREDEPDIIVKRRMRAVAGELGDVDPAALHEFLKDREIIYEAYSDTNCPVELDEEPPHLLNQQALEIALEVSLLLNAKIVDEVQVMRKTVIDGSNTSGFQRTALVAMDGYIETSEGRVGIPTICLEEDAARKMGEEGSATTYRLDRLGIPLIEICTDASIKNPKHAREVAEKLGMILRSTGKVKRGIGTIRQDLNVSILSGQRIEAKGVQDLRLISKVLKGEVERQLRLLEVKKELEERGVGFDKTFFKSFVVDVSGIFSENNKKTRSKIIKNVLEKNGVVLAVKLPGFYGLLGSKFCAIPGASKEREEKRRLGPEFAQYAKSASGVKGLFHSDELPAYGISQEEVDEIKRKLDCSDTDAFVLVAAQEKSAGKALDAVVERAGMAFEGVPKETRKAREDGSTEFMRPLPGSARMYPETDEPPISITSELIENIRKNLPELPGEKMKRYTGIGLSKEMANQMIHSNLCDTFDNFLTKFKEIDPTLIAVTLFSIKQMEKAGASFLNAFEQIEKVEDSLKSLSPTPEQMEKAGVSIGASLLPALEQMEKMRASFKSPSLTPEQIEKMRASFKSFSPTPEQIEGVLSLVEEGKISKEAIPEILAELGKNPKKTALDVMVEKGLGLMSKAEVEGVIAEIINQNKELIQRMGDKAFGPLMGLVMKELGGRADAGVVREILTEKL